MIQIRNKSTLTILNKHLRPKLHEFNEIMLINDPNTK